MVIFAEDPNDAQALESILRFLRPDIGTVRRPRRPLVLIKGRQAPGVKDSAERIAESVRREAKAIGRQVDLVIAHEDCDAVEPAHVELANRIVVALKRSRVPTPVAAVPAWEMEAWWYLWPQAVAAVCPGWRRLTRTGSVGMLRNVKDQLRRDLRPTERTRVPNYDETFGPRIASKVREQAQPQLAGVHSASYIAFSMAVAAGV